MSEQTCFYSFPNWLLGDHLGSTSMTANADGTFLSELRYSAFGETRYQNGSMTTDYLYTGQRQEAEIGLYYYVARWYDPYLNRWTQPDTIIPDLESPQSWNRYSYVFNNPVKYNDPTGHCPWCIGAAVGAVIGGIAGAVTYHATNDEGHRTNAGFWTAVAGGAAGGALLGSGLGMVIGAAGAVSAASAGAATINAGMNALAVASSTTASTLIGAGTGALASGSSYMLTNKNNFNQQDYLATTVIGTTTGAISGAIPTIDGLSPAVQFGLNFTNGAFASNAQYAWNTLSSGNELSTTNIVVNTVYGGMVEGVAGSLMPQFDGVSSLTWIDIPKRAAYTTASAMSLESVSTFMVTTGTTIYVEPWVEKIFME